MTDRCDIMEKRLMFCRNLCLQNVPKSGHQVWYNKNLIKMKVEALNDNQRISCMQIIENQIWRNTLSNSHYRRLLRWIFEKRGTFADPEIVKKWHDRLTQYVKDETSTVFIARKYSGGRNNNVWNSRRGAIIQFADRFEIVYLTIFKPTKFFWRLIKVLFRPMKILKKT